MVKCKEILLVPIYVFAPKKMIWLKVNIPRAKVKWKDMLRNIRTSSKTIIGGQIILRKGKWHVKEHWNYERSN